MKKLVQVATLTFLLLAPAPFVQAFYGDGPLIKAKIVLDKKQTGEKADRSIEITGVNSEGYIQGSTSEGKKTFQFSELTKIVFDLSRHAYDVTDRQGKTWTLTFAQLKTHTTSPTFDCLGKNAESGKEEEMMLDATQIKVIEFGEAVTAPAATATASEPGKP